MEKEEINEEHIEENQNTDPNEAKYMTFKGERIEVINTDEQNGYNQLNINQNENEFKENLENENIEEFNQTNERNQNLEERENNNIVYEREINQNMNDNFNKKEYYQNYRIKIIKHSKSNISNNNDNNDEYNKNEEIEIYDENADNNVVKNSKVHQIIVGNRRIERFDGAECNDNNNIVRQKQNDNDIFFNKGLQMEQNNIQDYNNNLNNFNNYNEQIQNNKITYNKINQVSSPKSQVQYKNINYQFNNQNLQHHHNDNNNFISYNQSKINKINNYSNYSEEEKSLGTIKEKNNYKLYSSNNCRADKNSYISKNYKGSEKTTFMQDKNTDNNYQKPLERLVIKNEEEPDASNHKVFVSTYTKTINISPQQNLSNIQMNQKNINNKQQTQTLNSEALSPKILIATSPRAKYVIPQHYVEQPQINIQNQKLNENSNPNFNNNIIQSTNQSKNNNQSLNQNYNNNINQNLNDNLNKNLNQNANQSSNQNYNQNISKNINQNLNHNQNERQNNINVIYPKEGYGNNENIQRQLKRKKKKKIIVRRQKPILQQHFDVQIIQNIQGNEIPQIYQNYQVPPNINQNNYNNLHQGYPIQQNIVPPVQNRHQNQYVYNSSQLVKIYPPHPEPKCNCGYHHQQYPPINPNSKSLPIQPHLNEGENHYQYKSPYRPKQTIISLTPMRTINQPTSPYQEFMQIHNNNEMRNYRKERRNREYRALTPPSYANNYEREYEFENNNKHFYHNYDNRRRQNAYSMHPHNYFIESRQELFDDNQEDDNLDENCPCCAYERRERIMKNIH